MLTIKDKEELGTIIGRSALRLVHDFVDTNKHYQTEETVSDRIDSFIEDIWPFIKALIEKEKSNAKSSL